MVCGGVPVSTMLMNKYDVVIIGSGSAGRTAAETLVERQGGLSILLVDREALLPYKRTKISKSIANGFSSEDFAIRASDWYESNNIRLDSSELLEIHPETHQLRLRDRLGGLVQVEYGMLLLSFGAVPRRPFPLHGIEKCSVLWTVADGLNLAERLKDCRRLVIVGMGVLGVEAAYQASILDIETTMVCRGSRPIARFLDEPTAAPLSKVLKDAGIHLQFGSEAHSMKVEHNDVWVETDRSSIVADYALITAGALPRFKRAAAAGIAVSRGILVDSSLRTSAPGIWAAGDCAEHPDGTITGLWHSAEHQGRLAALSMLGEKVTNTNPPFRLKCEVFGGYWFSAGDVNGKVEPEKLEAAETWETEDILWRPRFGKGRLKALAASAPLGMDKAMAKKAQRTVTEGMSPEETRSLLGA